MKIPEEVMTIAIFHLKYLPSVCTIIIKTIEGNAVIKNDIKI